MSAELVLAAMFPPRQEDMWNKLNFTWQPIPVHTVPVEEDYVYRLLVIMFVFCIVFLLHSVFCLFFLVHSSRDSLQSV